MFTSSSVRKVIGAIGKVKKDMERKEIRAVTKAGSYIYSESKKRTPVVTGKLRNSAYIKIYPNIGGSPEANIGYSANYAIYVHENPRAGQVGNYSTKAGKAYSNKFRPRVNKGSKRKAFSTVGQWKFLESVMKEDKNKIIDIMKRELVL